MAKNKKAFIETIRKRLSEIDPGNSSIDVICTSIEKMTASQFEMYIARLRNGIAVRPDISKPRELIPIVVPPLAKTKINNNHLKGLCDKWGVPYFERLWITDPVSNTRFLTNRPYVVLDLPMVRQAQTLEKGLGYSKDPSKLDNRTNQLAKTSKGSSLSVPELHALLSQGYQNVSVELMKFRGGDQDAYRKLSSDMMTTGKFYMGSYNFDTRAKSTDVAAMYWKACHIDNNL